MSGFYNVTNSNESDRGFKKRTIAREIVIGPRAIKFIAIAIVAILALVYLNQSTAGANRSIEVRELNSKEQELKLKKERLEVEKARLKSLNEINANIEKTQFEPMSKVDHLNDSGSALARN